MFVSELGLLQILYVHFLKFPHKSSQNILEIKLNLTPKFIKEQPSFYTTYSAVRPKL